MEHSLSQDTKEFIVHLVHAGLRLDLETVDRLLAKCRDAAEVRTPAGMEPWRILVPTERGGSPNYQVAWIDGANQIRWVREDHTPKPGSGLRQVFLGEPI